MKCNQCERPALYRMSDNTALCLDCNFKVSQIRYSEFLINAAMMNQTMDDMEMAVGMQMSNERIPVAELAKAAQGKTVHNNIQIDRSSVGVINTGDVEKINAAITLTKETDAEEIGLKLKSLTQTVLDSNEFNNTSKNELIDLIQSLSEQIIGSHGGRKKSVALSLLNGIEERVKNVSSAWKIFKEMIPLVKEIFDYFK